MTVPATAANRTATIGANGLVPTASSSLVGHTVAVDASWGPAHRVVR